MSALIPLQLPSLMIKMHTVSSYQKHYLIKDLGSSDGKSSAQKICISTHLSPPSLLSLTLLPFSPLPKTINSNALHPQRLLHTFLPPHDHVRTLYDNLEESISNAPDAPFLGHRSPPSPDNPSSPSSPGPYIWSTYREVGAARSAIGSGLLHFGISPNSAMGLYSINCPEWMLMDAAAHAYGMVTVPLYDTLGPETVQYIANHAELAVVGVSHALLPKLLEALPHCPTVKLVVVYGAKPYTRLPELPAGVRDHCKMHTLDRIRAVGHRNPASHKPPSPGDVALINYTSGTTGTPKGAVLTHGNIIANAAGAAAMLQPLFMPGDRHISYLPLAHIYERFNVTVQTHFCGAIGFYRGDVLELLEDIQELKPTLFASVPRLWNRIYDRVISQVESGNPITKKLFWTAFNSKKQAIQAGDLSGGRFAALWDAVVFSKVRARVGGHVRILSSGASPISSEVFEFLRVCFGAVVLEGYGMTESSCLITLTPPGDPMAGHVGAPIPSCEVKLADIPEMGYTNDDKPYPRGEVCVRGPIMFQGYFKDPENTAEAVDKDGWLHTGDVGAWLQGGRLKIIDRKKNIFKLAQGEYIAPEKIENVYIRSPFVMQSFVYGDSLKASLVGVVVPDPEYLASWAAQRGLPNNITQLCQDPKVNTAVLKSMQEEGRAAGLKGFEQVAAVYLTPEQFSVENGLMTPTFKVKRPQAQAAFQEKIQDMYSRIPAH